MTVVPLEDVWVTANLKETETAGRDARRLGGHHRGRLQGRAFPRARREPVARDGGEVLAAAPDNATGNFTKVCSAFPCAFTWIAQRTRSTRCGPV